MAAAATGHDVDVDGLNLHAEVAGSGLPVVLIHGFTGTGDSWRSLVDVLAPDFTTIGVDLVGHGRSGHPAASERYEMRRAVDDLAALLHTLGYERAAWLGYSLGGRVALQVAVHRPDCVSALVLEGATPGLETAEERAARVAADEALAQRLEREGLEAFVDYWQSIGLWDSQRRTLTEEQRAVLRRGRLAQDPVGLAGSLRGMGTGAQEWVGDRLGGIGVPVLLTAGTLDTKFSAIAREMAAAIPHATLRLVEDAGHAAHLERPDAFNAMVREFLLGARARLESGGGRGGDR